MEKQEVNSIMEAMQVSPVTVPILSWHILMNRCVFSCWSEHLSWSAASAHHVYLLLEAAHPSRN